VRVLAQAGADLNLPENRGWTALMIAASRGCVESIEALLGKKHHLEIEVGSKVIFLLQLHCWLQLRVLMIAASRGCVEPIEVLLGECFAAAVGTLAPEAPGR
jgi:ankyrin repeat protein